MRVDVDPSWWEAGVWKGRPVRDYLACRDMSAVFAFVHAHGNSYWAIGMATGLHPGRVAEIASGKRMVQAYDVFARIAEGLKIPRHYMGLGTGCPCGGVSGQPGSGGQGPRLANGVDGGVPGGGGVLAGRWEVR